MAKYTLPLLICTVILTSEIFAQTGVADTTLGPKPSLKIESLSAAGHCDNQQLTFYTPWADRYEIAKRRSDTAWIRGSKPTNTWSYQAVKPHVNSMIYKQLDERGGYQFIVRAYKGDHYRESDTVLLPSCITGDMQR